MGDKLIKINKLPGEPEIAHLRSSIFVMQGDALGGRLCGPHRSDGDEAVRDWNRLAAPLNDADEPTHAQVLRKKIRAQRRELRRLSRKLRERSLGKMAQTTNAMREWMANIDLTKQSEWLKPLVDEAVRQAAAEAKAKHAEEVIDEVESERKWRVKAAVAKARQDDGWGEPADDVQTIQSGQCTITATFHRPAVAKAKSPDPVWSEAKRLGKNRQDSDGRLPWHEDCEKPGGCDEVMGEPCRVCSEHEILHGPPNTCHSCRHSMGNRECTLLAENIDDTDKPNCSRLVVPGWEPK